MLRTIFFAVLLAFVSVFPSYAAPADMAETGQKICYSATGVVINCAGTGQDGQWLKGVALPGTRFSDNNNGTVTDNLTGLIWLKDANCFGAKIWAVALTIANGLSNGQCGLNDGSKAGDWRLPNRKELRSLIDYSMSGPALPSGHPFINVQALPYWSSTTYASDQAGGWVVSMFDGYVNFNYKPNDYYVWPVRSGQ